MKALTLKKFTKLKHFKQRLNNLRKGIAIRSIRSYIMRIFIFKEVHASVASYNVSQNLVGNLLILQVFFLHVVFRAPAAGGSLP